MIKCPNCGAEIDKDISRCPYCGYINAEGAQKKFESDLSEIRDDIEETKKEPAKALEKGFFGGTRTILIVVCALVVIAGLLALELAREMKNKPKEFFLSAEDQAYASAYKAAAGKELNDAYADKDIGRMAAIFDKAYSEDRVVIWGVDHYETGYASSCYMKLKKCLPNLDKEKIGKKEAEEITYYCFYFYYRAYGEDGEELFDPIREEEIIPIITERLGYTEEDMEAFKDKVMIGDGVNRTNVYKATRKYYGNYH